MKKPSKTLTNEIKELYKKLNEHRSKALDLEYDIQEWFNERGLEMMNEDENGELL